jgi:hypothetical protein
MIKAHCGIRIGYACFKAEISDRPSWMRHQLGIFHPSRIHQDVYGFKAEVLVEWNES